MGTIHTVGQTVTHHPVVTVMAPLSRNFAHCGFLPKVYLQPLTGIVSTGTPGSDPTLPWYCIETAEVRSVVGVVRT